MTPLDLALLAIGLALIALCLLILARQGRNSADPRVEHITGRVSELHGMLSGLREDHSTGGRLARDELSAGLDRVAQGLAATLGQLGAAQGERLDVVLKHVSNGRIETENHATKLRTELTGSFETLGRGLTGRMAEHGLEQGTRLKEVSSQMGERLVAVAGALRELGEANERRQEALRTSVLQSLKDLSDANERRGDELRRTVEGRLDALRTENTAKLDEMRATVDEKLQGTLEARLGASFAMVNDNLKRVHESVGEMQAIATGVGDLKRVLSNVKARGTWGETTLGMLLEQVMTPEQYATNVEVKPGSGCRVEYAIRLPGGEGDAPVWLPIDAKLPTEDYERLVEASERGDAAAVEDAAKGLERAIRKCGQDIGTKYVDPPHSTDFGIMFLPTEGLFAEVARRPGLVDALQREARVTVAGPTTLMATLVALRMGFRSLAIQKRSSEVWQVLGAVKSEFGKFGDVLDKVQKKLGEAQTVVESAGVRRRAVDRKLRDVEALPEAAAQDPLALPPGELPGDLLDEAAE